MRVLSVCDERDKENAMRGAGMTQYKDPLEACGICRSDWHLSEVGA